MPSREAVLARHGPLDELRTIQVLEESLGPKSIRRLRRYLEDRGQREVLDDVARDASATLRELDDVIHEWTSVGERPEEAVVTPEETLDVQDVLSSVIELKESEAQLFRRAAEDAPSEELRARLVKLASQAEEMAERLQSLL